MRGTALICSLALAVVLCGCSSDEPATTTTSGTAAPGTTPVVPSGPAVTSDAGSRFSGLADPIGGIAVESAPFDDTVPVSAPPANPGIPAGALPVPPPANTRTPIPPAARRGSVPPPPPPPSWPPDRWTTPSGR